MEDFDGREARRGSGEGGDGIGVVAVLDRGLGPFLCAPGPFHIDR